MIFISHGIKDTVLPIERCGRAIARRLTGEGYEIDYVNSTMVTSSLRKWSTRL
jgi:hypothetical protein